MNKNELLLNEKLSGMCNKYTIQAIQRCIDKNDNLTLSDFLGSGQFVTNHNKENVVRYLGGLYIQWEQGVYFTKVDDLHYESANLKDVEIWLWENKAEKMLNE